MLRCLFEYLLTLSVSGAFLATLLENMGVSDALKGVMQSTVSLGCVMQLVAVVVPRKGTSVKRWIIALSAVKNLFYLALYGLPFLPLPPVLRGVCCFALLLGGHLLTNLLLPATTTWLIAFVPGEQRGVFCARKEQLSLLGGFLFSYALGTCSDWLTQRGNVAAAGVLFVCVVALCAVGSLLSLRRVSDAPAVPKAEVSWAAQLREIVSVSWRNKPFRRMIGLETLWRFAMYFSISYLGAYQIKVLGFSLGTVALLEIGYSVLRILFASVMGRLSDRRGILPMLRCCFAVAACAFAVGACLTPGNGGWLFIVFYGLYAIAMAGINNGLLNVTYQLLPAQQAQIGYGVKGAAGGLAGFAASLLGSVIVSRAPGAAAATGLCVQPVLFAVSAALCVAMAVFFCRSRAARQADPAEA